MRSRWLFALPFVLCVIPAAAWGQGRPTRATIGELAPDFRLKSDDEVSDDKEKGEWLLERHRRKNVVALCFLMANAVGADDTVKVLKDLHDKFGRQGLLVYAWIPLTKDKAESWVKGKDLKTRFIYGGKPDEYGASYPRIYLIDTNGILTDAFHPLDRAEERVRLQMQKTPPPGADPQSLRANLTKASEALQKKDFGRAYILAKDVDAVLDEGDNLKAKTKTLLEQIQEAAKKWLEEAREAVKNGKEKEGCQILAELSVRFSGSDVAHDADTEIAALMGDVNNKGMMRKALDNVRGWMLNDEAEAREQAARYVEAIKLYEEAVEKYPDTEAAEQAGKRIDAVNADPRAKEMIAQVRAEDEARRWLEIGDRFAKVEMYVKAREYYDKVLEKHPQSKAAAAVPERLKGLPEKDPVEAADDDGKAAQQDAPDKPGENDAGGEKKDKG